jgi:hypothetical protein
MTAGTSSSSRSGDSAGLVVESDAGHQITGCVLMDIASNDFSPDRI